MVSPGEVLGLGCDAAAAFLWWLREGVPPGEALERARALATGEPCLDEELQRMVEEALRPGEEPRRERRRAQRRRTSILVPWQAYAVAAVLASAALGPLAIIGVAAPLVAARLAPNYMPPARLARLRVREVGVDVWGMDAITFASRVKQLLRVTRGVQFDGRDAWVLVDPGNVEAARRELARLGVATEPDGELVLEPDRRYRYATVGIALLGLAAAAANPLAAFGALATLLLTLREKPGVPRRGVADNPHIYAAVEGVAGLEQVREEAKHGVATPFTLLWERNEAFIRELEKRMDALQRKARFLEKARLAYALELLHRVRRRLMENQEDAYRVWGWGALREGRPRVVDALSLDLARFTPFALRLAPSRCEERSAVLGVDELGRVICWSPYDTPSPHIALVGATGAGKTTWLTAVAEQLWRHAGIRPVAIDPHGQWRVGEEVVDASRAVPAMELAPDDAAIVVDVVSTALLAQASREAKLSVEATRAEAYTLIRRAISLNGSARWRDLPLLVERAAGDAASRAVAQRVLGILYDLAESEERDPAVLQRGATVTTFGDTRPAAVARLMAWLAWFFTATRRSGIKQRYEYLVVVDEAHVLLAGAVAMSKAYREIRKFGVAVATITQRATEIDVDIVTNSGLLAVLAISKVDVDVVAQAFGLERDAVERMATEPSLQGERYGLVRFMGRATPLKIKLVAPWEAEELRARALGRAETP